MHTLDSDLFQLLGPFLREDYQYFVAPGNDAQRGAFMTRACEAPEFMYPLITLEVLAQLRHALETLGRAVANRPLCPVVVGLYNEKMQEYLHTIAMLDATRVGDDEAFFTQSTALYGAPEEAYYAYCMRTLYHQVNTVRRRCAGETHVAEACMRLGHMSAPYADRVFPWDEIVLLTETIDNGESLTALQVKQLFDDAIGERTLPISTFIREPRGKPTFAFDKVTDAVVIPPDADLALRKMKPTETRMRALFAHEFGVHAVRAVNGLRSPLQLLGVGFAGYLKGEEGVAKWYEQRVTGARFFEVRDSYLAVSLATGMDGTPRAFRALYEVLCDVTLVSILDTMLYHGEDIDFTACVRKAHASAWDSTLNVFRGTTGRNPGTCYTKGCVYLPGNIEVSMLLKREPAWEEKLLTGKFDPCNAGHVSALSLLGIL